MHGAAAATTIEHAPHGSIMTSTPAVLPPAPAPGGGDAAASAPAPVDTSSGLCHGSNGGGVGSGGNGGGNGGAAAANGNGYGDAHVSVATEGTAAGDAVAAAAGQQALEQAQAAAAAAAKRKLLEQEAIPLGGDGFELLPPSPSVPARLLKPYLDPQPAGVDGGVAQHLRPQSPAGAASSAARPSLVPKPLSAVVLPPTSPTAPPQQAQQQQQTQQQPPTATVAAAEAAAAVSPLMQRPAPGSYVPCQRPPATHQAFLPPDHPHHHQPPPQQQPPLPSPEQEQQQEQQRPEAEAEAEAAAAAAVVEVPTTPAEGFPSLERRRELMDATIAKLKADIEAVRASEGFDCPLLLLYGERAVTARKRALADAERHRRHMEGVSEAMARHDVEEAEAAFKANLESFREQLVEERVQELRRCEESLKAAAAAGAGGAAAVADAPLRTVMTRHAKSKAGVGGLGGSGSGAGGGGNGSDADGAGGGLEKEGSSASSMARKRRRGQSPASAFLHKALRRAEAETDLSAMAADVKFALERPGESGEDDAGENGEGGGKNGGRIPVRVEKGVVHYGAEPAVPLAKGTSLVVTLPRTDDQYVATLQSFNQMEIFIKVHGGSGVTGLGLGLGATLASSRKRIPLSDLMDGTVLLDVAISGGEGGGHRRGRSASGGEDVSEGGEEDEDEEDEEDEEEEEGERSSYASSSRGGGRGGGHGGKGKGGLSAKKRARLLMAQHEPAPGGKAAKLGRPSSGRGSRGGRVGGGKGRGGGTGGGGGPGRKQQR